MRQDLLRSVLGDKSNLLAQIDEKSVEESRHHSIKGAICVNNIK